MKQILCFGDSNTYGLIPKEGGGYPWGIRRTSILNEKLGVGNYRVIEEGLCGRTTIFDDPLREGRCGIQMLPAVLETHNPIDITVVMLGTNDCKTIYGATADFIGKGISKIISQIRINAGESVNKAESAKLPLQKLNDRIEIRAYSHALTVDNAEEIISKYDFIIDAADNFETKFLINDVCVLLEKAFCHAGILQFEGQVMTYVPGNNPCYRCVFEEIPECGSIPNCSQAGIIGAVAGIIGSIQALEAVKYLLGAGELLTGKIFVLDGLSMRTRIVCFNSKNENCKVCCGHRTITNIREELK